MEFKLIHELDIETDLIALRRDTQPYSLLLYQHEGHLHADETCIRNASNVEPKLMAFLNRCVETSADLCMTPEYCCSWNFIITIINTPSQWPKEGKLWVLGAESLNLAQLRDLRQVYDDVLISFDERVLDKDGSYLDPVVYLFRGEHAGRSKLIVLLQFKTFHMGVWSSALEAKNLIKGNEVYVLKNSYDSIRFMTLICSEAMNFEKSMAPEAMGYLDWTDKPYLIFNPQLNPNPSHDNFLQFKKFLFITDRKELITLNWNRNSLLMGKPLTQFNTSRSGLFLDCDEVDLSLPHIKRNHQLGMYYYSRPQHKHFFILNSNAHLFYLTNSAVHITAGVPAQRRRIGPAVREVFQFDAPVNDFADYSGTISDSHLALLDGVACSCSFLTNVAGCVIEKEILVTLTTGSIVKKSGTAWKDIAHLYSIQSDERSEVNYRITFTEDTFPESIDQRSKYIDSIATLDHQIFTNTHLFPSSIADLKDFILKIGYYPGARTDGYKYNVTTADGTKRNATICYLGSVAEAKINQVFDNVQDMFDCESKNRDRVVIFYRRAGTFHTKSVDKPAAIDDTNIYANTSILKSGI